MSKRVSTITKEMIDTLIEKKGSAVALIEIFYRHFDKQEEDPARPSKELALYLFKKGIEIKNEFYSGPPKWTKLLLELGYINLSELLDIVSVASLDKHNRGFLTSLFLSKQCPFPKEEKEMDEILSKLNIIDRKILVGKLLGEYVDFSEEPENHVNVAKFRNLQNNYITLQNRFCAYFINNSYITENRAWLISSYIPTDIIINKFKKALPFYGDAKAAFSILHLLMENTKLPFKQLLELIEFFRTFPLTSPSFPYSEKGEMVAILQILPKYEKEIMAADSAVRCKLYNTFIKPLKNNPSLMETYAEKYEIVLTITAIAAILVPSGELISLIKDTLTHNITLSERSIIQKIAFVRNRTHAPVPIEFILLQDKYSFCMDDVCFNNDCINDIDFWIKRRERVNQNQGDIISNYLSYNSSFLYWFKPNPKDLPVYRKLYEDGLISSMALNKVRNLPKEFIVAFCEVMSIVHLNDNVLENIIDKDIVSLFLDTRKEERIIMPNKLFLLNKTFDPAFFAKYAMKLTSIDRGFIGSKSNVKLSDVVRELV